MNVVRKAIPIVAAVSVLGCAATGFIGDWLHGGPTGWGLMVHMALAAPVMLAFAAIALIWGGVHRFDRTLGRIGGVRKLLFWLLLLSAFVCTTTMLAAMFPIFGYIGQDKLVDAHELGGIGVLVAGLLYGLSARRETT